MIFKVCRHLLFDTFSFLLITSDTYFFQIKHKILRPFIIEISLHWILRALTFFLATEFEKKLYHFRDIIESVATFLAELSRTQEKDEADSSKHRNIGIG